MKKQIVIIVLFFFSAVIFSQEISSVNLETNVNLPTILIMEKSFSFSYLNLQTKEKLKMKEVLSTITNCPGNEDNIKKMKQQHITGYCFTIPGILLFSSSFAVAKSNPTKIENLDLYMMGVGTLLGFVGAGFGYLEDYTYRQSVNNYNLWIMGIPFEVGIKNIISGI